MKYIYAVCSNTIIDGGAPGYFSFCFCSSRKEAERYKEYLEGIFWNLKPWEESAFLESEYLFGYLEGINREPFYIQKIPIIDTTMSFIEAKAYFAKRLAACNKEQEEWLLQRKVEEEKRRKEREEFEAAKQEGRVGDNLYELLKRNKNGRK